MERVEYNIRKKTLDFEAHFPSLSEQKAIVKRVDELMALLDEGMRHDGS